MLSEGLVLKRVVTRPQYLFPFARRDDLKETIVCVYRQPFQTLDSGRLNLLEYHLRL